MEYLFDQPGGSFCPKVDNLIDKGFDEEEVASEHVDCDEEFAATLPVDPESDEGEEVCYIVYYIPSRACLYAYLCAIMYAHRAVRQPHRRKVRPNRRLGTH